MVNYAFPADTSVSDYARDLIRALLIKRPDVRIKPEHILEHKFFKGYIPEKLPREFLKKAPSQQYIFNCENYSNHYMFNPQEVD